MCRLEPGARVPDWCGGGSFLNIVRSPDELSIVCLENLVPAGVHAEMGWVALRLNGPFAFSMTGVLASFLVPLAVARVPIFAVSTFDTDFVLIKRDDVARAKRALGEAGHQADPEAE